MKKVLIAGSLNMDLVLRVARFPIPGETLLGDDFSEHIGGKGANQASACALQGVPTTLWGCLGQDGYGDIISLALKRLSIKEAVGRKEIHTGLAVIEVCPDGQNRIVIARGANAKFTAEEAKKRLSLLDENDILVLQNEIPVEASALLINEAKKRDKTVIFNPAPALAINPDLLPLIDYLIPNEHELSLAAQMPTDDPKQIKNAMEALYQKGVGCIITTLGSKGSLCYNGQFTSVPAVAVKAVDTTGAGDSFVGAFAAYLAQDAPLGECLSKASYAASLSVTRSGAFGSAGSRQEINAKFCPPK